MGISYNNFLVYGIKLDKDFCKTIIEPAHYELQNRYDTRTGKVAKQEKVCIKDEESLYVFNSYKNEDFWDLASDIARSNGLGDYYDGESFVIGYEVIPNKDFGGARLIDGKITMNDLLDFHSKISRMFPFDSEKIGLYGVASVG